MYIVILSAIIINIIAIIILSVGLFYNFENPKHKAIYGYIITGSFFLYILFLSLIAILLIILKQSTYSLILLLCVISPFVIGKLVKYKTLKIYTIIQIMCFILSLITLYINII